MWAKIANTAAGSWTLTKLSGETVTIAVEKGETPEQATERIQQTYPGLTAAADAAGGFVLRVS